MWQIFIGSLALSVIHAAIPNHWIPLIVISKTEKWSIAQTLSATVITGFAHTLSTILIGILIGFIGINLSAGYNLITQFAAPAILMAIGLIYIIIDPRGNGHHHHHHSDFDEVPNNDSHKSTIGILVSLSVAMFLTPCVEIEAYYFQAGLLGWKGIFMVSAVYTLTTVLFMIVLVYAGLKGTARFRFHILEHHEKLITGLVLVILGLSSVLSDINSLFLR